MGRRKLTLSDKLEDFFSRIEIKSSPDGRFKDCWYWTGAVTDDGYGSFNVRCENKHIYRAHRFSRYIFDKNFDLNSDLLVLHKCDNPMCVNPDHLFEGTNDDNMNDMVSKGRSCKGTSQKDAKMNEESVLKLRSIAHLYTRKELGIMFNINKSIVTKIVNRQLWKHV